MYNNMLFGMKRRILKEVENAFLDHPAFSEKVEIHNKFPYEDRLQYGVVLRNTSASQIRMSADNYLGDLKSHIRLIRDADYPGLGIEWIHENTADITTWIEEDVSSQVDPTNRLFTTTYQMLQARGNTNYANSYKQVTVTVNGSEVNADSVDGENKKFILRSTPSSGDEVKIQYWRRTLVDPGIYVIDFDTDNSFIVGPIYIVEGEVLAERTTGLETGKSFAHGSIYPDTEEIFLRYPNRARSDSPIILVKGTDYVINYVTGEVGFLQPIEAGFEMTCDYRWQPGHSFGPFTFEKYQEVHDAVRGCIICIGRRAKEGDRQIVIVSRSREPQAKVYGGHWEMSLSLGVISKDPIQMAEMTDHVVNYLWGIRKNILEFEGITFNSVEPTGETEESFIETTGDLYYESSVDISVMTEWQRFVPYLFKIKYFNIGLFELEPDTREVVMYGKRDYEKVQ